MLWMWLLAGCSMLGGGGGGQSCDLTLEGLPGSTWVMLAAQGGVEKKDHMARLRFRQKGEEIVADYTVASPSDVYEYPCIIREGAEEGDKRELYCAQEQRLVAWCQAFLVADAICSKKSLRKAGAEGTDEELNKAIIEAKKNVREMRDKGGQDWKKFQFLNNFLGNKLQGRLYVTIDEKQCRLSVGDFYWTIHNGRPVEDTNPVGQNPFVKDGGDYLWENCTDGNSLAMTSETALDLEAIREHYLETGERIGMKPAGGIRTAKQSLHYLVMLAETLGADWMTPQWFRFGASSVVNDLLHQIARRGDGHYASPRRFSVA